MRGAPWGDTLGQLTDLHTDMLQKVKEKVQVKGRQKYFIL